MENKNEEFMNVSFYSKFKKTETIGCISDLHIGKDNKINKANTLKIAYQKFMEKDVSYVFCLGDIFDEINKQNIELFHNFYKDIKIDTFSILGDHDKNIEKNLLCVDKFHISNLNNYEIDSNIDIKLTHKSKYYYKNFRTKHNELILNGHTHPNNINSIENNNLNLINAPAINCNNPNYNGYMILNITKYKDETSCVVNIILNNQIIYKEYLFRKRDLEARKFKKMCNKKLVYLR